MVTETPTRTATLAAHENPVTITPPAGMTPTPVDVATRLTAQLRRLG